MTVFRAFMKLFKAHKWTLMIYLWVFGVFGTLSASANSKTMQKAFEYRKVKVVVVDHDKSRMSGIITDYVKENEKKVDFKTTDEKALNDYIRFEMADYAIVIPKGFGEDFSAGKDTNLKYISAGTSSSSQLMTRKINTLLGDIKAYMGSGLGLDEAVEKSLSVMKSAEKAEVTLKNNNKGSGKGYLYYVFNFAAYGFLMMLCEAVGMIMVEIKKKDTQRRINVSSYSFKRRNAELIAGILVSGVIMLIPFIIISAIYGNGKEDAVKLGYYALNLAVIMFPGIGLGYFVSAVTDNSSIINMLANSIILTLSFISGVFVTREFLSAGIMNFSKAFPLYWYVEANEIINGGSVGNIINADFGVCVIMQLLFAAALFAAGLIVTRARERA